MNGWTIAGLIGLFGIMVTVILWVVSRTPNKNKVVYTDTCKQTQISAATDRKRIEDCLEQSITHLEEKVDDHHNFNKSEFKEIKDILRNSR